MMGSLQMHSREAIASNGQVMDLLQTANYAKVEV